MEWNGACLAVVVRLQRCSGERHENLSADGPDRYPFHRDSFHFGAGTAFAALDAVLAERGQECPLDPRDPAATIGGILGALLLLALFDWVLILLSSVEGAHLIGNGIVLPQSGAVLLFVALVVIGVVVQGSMLRGSRRAAG